MLHIISLAIVILLCNLVTSYLTLRVKIGVPQCKRTSSTLQNREALSLELKLSMLNTFSLCFLYSVTRCDDGSGADRQNSAHQFVLHQLQCGRGDVSHVGTKRSGRFLLGGGKVWQHHCALSSLLGYVVSYRLGRGSLLKTYILSLDMLI